MEHVLLRAQTPTQSPASSDPFTLANRRHAPAPSDAGFTKPADALSTVEVCCASELLATLTTLLGCLRARCLEKVQITDAEAVVCPLLVEHCAETLERRTAACIGWPPFTIRDGRGTSELRRSHGPEPFLEFCRLLGAHGSHLVQAGVGRQVESLLFAIRHISVASPIGVNNPVDPRTHRRNHES